MTAVMQNNPSVTVADDEDDVALAAFLAPNWGRFDQDQLAFDIMSYRQTASEHYTTRQRKSSSGDIQGVQKSSSTPVLRSRDRQSMPPLYQHKPATPPRREDSPVNRPSTQRRDESPKQRSSSGHPRRESPPSRSSDTSRDASPRRSSPHNPRSTHSYSTYPPPPSSDHKIPISLQQQQQIPKRTPTPLPLLTQSSAQFTQERRPSVTSIASKTPSIRSEMSINTKLSLSKRLRRVFSMSSLSSKANDSTVSLQSQVSVAESDVTPKSTRSSTGTTFVLSSAVDSSESGLSAPGPQPISSVSSPAKPSSRRRSIVSLSNIFSRNNSSSGANKQKAQQVEPTVAAVVVPAQTGVNQRHSAADLRKMMNDKETDKTPATNRSSPSNKPERPKLDTSLESIQQTTKGSLKNTRRGSASNGKPPDSPSSISSSSRSPVTPPPHRQLPRLHGTYAAAVSSNLSANGRQRQSSLTSNSSSRADYFSQGGGGGDFDQSEELVPPPTAGLHSLALHGSPRMKPASQSNTSLSEPSSIREMPPAVAAKTRRLGFSSSITVHETFSPSEYDRRCDPNVTCCKLTPEFAMRIKQELNEYKLTGMEVHIESRQYTHFFL